MKKIIYIFTAVLALTLVGCYGDDVSVELQEITGENSETLTAAEFNDLSSNAFEVKRTTDSEQGNESESAVTISWNAATTSTSESISYMVQLDAANNKFETAVTIPLGNGKISELSQALTYEQLNNAVNKIAINLTSVASSLGVVFDETNSFDMRLVSILGANIAMKYSKTTQISITPYFTGLVNELVFSGEALSNVDVAVANTNGNFEARINLTNDKTFKIYASSKEDGISYNYTYFSSRGYTIDSNLMDDSNAFKFTGNTGTWDIVINSSDKTITLSEVIIPDNLYMVGSHNGWNNADATQKFTYVGDGIFIKVQAFDAGSEFKLLPTSGSWDGDWGLDPNNEGKIIQEGEVNIPVADAGTYMVRIDFNALTYTVSPVDSWGLVGSATPNGWGGPDVPFYLNKSNVTEFIAYATLIEGEFKIRKDNDWAVNYGDDGADGTLESGGSNIVVEAGTYKIVFNPEAKTYTIEEHSWGLVGSATPNEWNGPDVVLTPDISMENVWKATNVALQAGEIKFRLNNDWGVNYGDDGADGSLEAGGANITVEEGTYNIMLDLSDSNAPTYTLEKQ